MNCPQCQKPLAEEARFCLHCGAWIPRPAPTQRLGAVAIDAAEGKNIIHTGTAGQAAGPTATAPDQAAAGRARLLEKAGITLVYVPRGEFLMGSSDDDPLAGGDEKPQHRVQVDGFWIGQTPVTCAQYRRFIQAGGYSQRELWGEEGWNWKLKSSSAKLSDWDQTKSNESGCPVVGVSWYEAEAFAHWVGGRLPSEAEWEYAARGGPLSRGYGYAGSDNPGDVAWYKDNSGGKTHPVGQKKPNELELFDMSGNVWEWCGDWYGAEYYQRTPDRNPPGLPAGEYRVIRGGSWYDMRLFLRTSLRDRSSPSTHYTGLGFRVASPVVP